MATATIQMTSAARAALAYIRPDQTVGLGSGATSHEFVRLLGTEVAFAKGLRCVATSTQTEVAAAAVGLQLVDPNSLATLDVSVDGADEATTRLELIKGGGGAMVRERIVASMSQFHITILDAAKVHPCLGQFYLPIEIAPYAHRFTASRVLEAMSKVGCDIEWHRVRTSADGEAFVTDNGHHILDVKIVEISNPNELSEILYKTIGVVDHGIFIGLSQLMIAANADGSVQHYELTE